jgi:hypothetical protein
MRRILSMFLLLVFAFPLVAPALGQNTQKRLLLCCRKGGAHHCLASMTMEDGQPAPAFRAHCPACSNPAVTGHGASWMNVSVQSSGTEQAVTSLRIRQVEAGYRISSYRSRQMRGPPTAILL